MTSIKQNWFLKSIILIIVYFTTYLHTKDQNAFLKGWYPRTKKSLELQLKELDQEAAKTYPSSITNARIAIVPHAGWKYSGILDAACLRCLDKNTTRIILLAPLHNTPIRGIVLPSYNRYKLPLGTLTVDTHTIKSLKKNSLFYQASQKKHLTDPHTSEHSLEVLLPFIYYYFPQATIVPLFVGTLTNKELQQAINTLKPTITHETALVVSSDFTHYGPLYNFIPCEKIKNKEACINHYDDQLIQLITKYNPFAFLQSVKNNGDTICGKYPIALALGLAKNTFLHTSKATCIGRSHSQIINHTDQNRVSYVGMVYAK